MPLRQALTDFAYQLAKHAYELAECKPARDFPGELPRHEEGDREAGERRVLRRP